VVSSLRVGVTAGRKVRLHLGHLNRLLHVHRKKSGKHSVYVIFLRAP